MRANLNLPDMNNRWIFKLFPQEDLLPHYPEEHICIQRDYMRLTKI